MLNMSSAVNINTPLTNPLDCESSKFRANGPSKLLDSSTAPEGHTLNVSNLPNSCWTSSSSHQSMDSTSWELKTSPRRAGQFLSSKMQVESVFISREVTNSMLELTSVLTSPYDITFLQPAGTKGFYLVTEPPQDHVGVYSSTDMAYLGPLGRGIVQFQSPTSILSLKGVGGLVLIDKHYLHLFDDHCRRLQKLPVKYHGLTEGMDKDIYTMQGMTIVQFSKDKGMYHIKKIINLTVVEDFDKWYILSKPRHLLYNMGRLYISDSGLHKLFMVNLSSGHQTAWGYLGEGIGQIKRPTGMVADRNGNLLLVDQGNNRIIVYTSSGIWVKVGVNTAEQPCGIVLCGGSVMVSFMGNMGRAGIVKYTFED